LSSTHFFEADSVLDARRWQMPPLNLPANEALHTAQHFDDLGRTAYDDGHARGYAEGQAQGYADGAARVRDDLDRLRLLLDRFSRPLQALDEEVERLLVSMAIDVGRRLAQQTLDADPARVAVIVREALAVLGQPLHEVRIHLHPDDVALLRSQPPAEPDSHRWQLVADAELGRGDCRVVSDGAQVDARMDTREAGLARALLGDPR
jgi:flagellar assembly protein FliH